MHQQNHSFRELPKHALLMLSVTFLCLLFLFCPSCLGQAVSATLLGNVTDNTGAVLPNAQVQIVESATGIEHAGTTNESGNFTFPDLTPGTYTVSVQSQGFKK